MTGKQFRVALERRGMTVDAFAERCGIDRSTAFRFIAEDRVPKWAAWLVSLLPEKSD